MSSTIINPLRNLAGYQLRRASSVNMDELGRDLSALGLRPSTASILLLIGANRLIRSSEIGRELAIQRANMTPLIAALERDGLVERQSTKGRSHGLVLTAAGEKLQLNALQLMWRFDEKMLSKLTTNERLQFIHLLSLAWSGGGSAASAPAAQLAPETVDEDATSKTMKRGAVRRSRSAAPRIRRVSRF